MQLGIFAKTFQRPNLEEVWDQVANHGLRWVQFNFVCAGMATMPMRIDTTLADRIRRETLARQIEIAAVSGTFNMIHPDATKRRFGLERLRTLAGVCARIGTPMITLCTGTRDPVNMWKHHSLNDSPEAWADLLASVQQAVQIAEEFNLQLGIEPEVGNVVDSAKKARQLLDQMRSPRLRIVFDGANLFHGEEISQMKKTLKEGLDLLAPEIAMAHAKDISRTGVAGSSAAGQGLLDFDFYLSQLEAVGFTGPLILHGLTESQVPESLSFIQSKMPRQRRLL